MFRGVGNGTRGEVILLKEPQAVKIEPDCIPAPRAEYTSFVFQLLLRRGTASVASIEIDPCVPHRVSVQPPGVPAGTAGTLSCPPPPREPGGRNRCNGHRSTRYRPFIRKSLTEVVGQEGRRGTKLLRDVAHAVILHRRGDQQWHRDPTADRPLPARSRSGSAPGGGRHCVAAHGRVPAHRPRPVPFQDARPARDSRVPRKQPRHRHRVSCARQRRRPPNMEEPMAIDETTLTKAHLRKLNARMP